MQIKPTDFGTLQVQQVIFHDVPKHKVSAPTLADVPTAVTAAHVSHLRTKLTKVLQSSHAYPVVFDIATASPVPAGVRGYTKTPTPTSFVAMSQQLAQHLWTHCNGGVSPGLLCVLDVTVRQMRAIALMKLEREEGARLELNKDAAGKKQFSMSVLDN